MSKILRNGALWEISVLDHGYVRFIDKYGCDERIIEAARMSVQRGFIDWGPYDICDKCMAFKLKGETLERLRNDDPHGNPWCDHVWRDVPKGDAGLLAFLWKNNHASPFEMAGMTIEVQAPIFVFREWHRHRTQSYNEASARYTPLPDVNYIPSVERLMINASASNKQAGTVAGAEIINEITALWFQDSLIDLYARDEELYQEALKRGVPKELARVHLPVGRYSKMMAHTDLRNWLGFLNLRMAPNAQWEIRQYANAVHELLKEAFPRTLELFDEARKT